MQTTSLDVLENAKLPPDQARAILKVMESEFAVRYDGLATRTDMRDALHASRTDMRDALHASRTELRDALHAARTELHDAMQATRTELHDAMHALELKIESVRSDLVRWVFVCTFGQAALLAGVVYFVLTYVRR